MNKLLLSLNSIHRSHDSDGLTAEKFIVRILFSLSRSFSMTFSFSSGLGSRPPDPRHCPSRWFTSTTICREIRRTSSVYYQRTSLDTKRSGKNLECFLWQTWSHRKERSWFTGQISLGFLTWTTRTTVRLFSSKFVLRFFSCYSSLAFSKKVGRKRAENNEKNYSN